MIISPYTYWEGDDVHGKTPVIKSVWVNLDALFARAPGAPRHVIETGLLLTGQVQGRMHGRFPGLEGSWAGVIDYELSYADGRRDQVRLVDQFLPFSALRER